MKKELCFVLKRFLPLKQKLSLLTRYQGKVDVAVLDKKIARRIWPGMIIATHLNFSKDFYIASEIEILSAPMEESAQHMPWIEHLLELCLNFLPPHMPCNDVFAHLYESMSVIGMCEDHAILKKLCTAKLLLLFGCYPGKELIEMIIWRDEFFAGKRPQMFDYSSEHLIDKFIIEAINGHPLQQNFKTTKYLYGD